MLLNKLFLRNKEIFYWTSGLTAVTGYFYINYRNFKSYGHPKGYEIYKDVVNR